jgi:creatinine amidohydrolase
MNYSEYIYLRPHQLQAEIERFPLALVPLGALEWHSYHLPLGTDGLKAEFLLRKTGKKLGKGVLFPTKYWGAFRTLKFPWTFQFSRIGQEQFYKKMVKSLYKMGFRIIILLTGHYPEAMPRILREIAKRFMRRHSDCFILGITEYFFLHDFMYFGDHAARWETSLEMVANPDCVKLNELPNGYNFIQRSQHLGIQGQDPLLTSSKEEGEKLTNVFTNRLVESIEKTWESKSQQVFLEIYDNFYGARAKLFKKENREKGLSVLGWDNIKDLWKIIRWFFKNGLKYIPDETEIKNES